MAKLLTMQIDRDTARDVVRDLFGDDDHAALIDVALDRRLRGRVEKLSNPDERRKIIAYLVRQGFSPRDALSAIRRKTANPDA
jgi:SOS response regulatory protein OraA/RecX